MKRCHMGRPQHLQYQHNSQCRTLRKQPFEYPSSTAVLEEVHGRSYYRPFICSYRLLLCYINSLSEHIKFTDATVQDKCIPYLNLLIKRQINEQLRFPVQRKHMHTCSVFNCIQLHSIVSQKLLVSLFYRADTYCREEFKKAEISTVKQSLTLNSYSNKLLNNTCLQNASITANCSTNTEVEGSVSARYDQRVCRLLNGSILSLGKSRQLLLIKSQLCHVKDRRAKLNKNSVVYHIKCKECNSQNIGEMTKELSKKKHQNSKMQQ